MSAEEVKKALFKLGEYRMVLSRHQLKTLQGQVLSGEIDGAMRGLRKIISTKERGAKNEPRKQGS